MSKKYTSLLALGTARIWIKPAHRICAVAEECQVPLAVNDAIAHELTLAIQTYDRLLAIHLERSPITRMCTASCLAAGSPRMG